MLVNIRLNRINLLIGLAIAIIISDSIIYFSEVESKEFYSNWIIIINASIAAGLATLVLYRHKQHDGLFDKSHAALASRFMSVANCRHYLGSISNCSGNRASGTIGRRFCMVFCIWLLRFLFIFNILQVSQKIQV